MEAVGTEFTSKVEEGSVRAGSAKLEEKIGGGSEAEASSWAVIGVGILVALNTLLVKWCVELLINSGWSTSTRDRYLERGISPVRYYYKRVFDDPIHMIMKSPMVYARAMFRLVAGPLMLSDGLAPEEVDWIERVSRESEAPLNVSGYQLRGWHVFGALWLLFGLVVLEAGTSVSYLAGLRSFGAVRGRRTEVEIEVDPRSGLQTLSHGTRAAQEISALGPNGRVLSLITSA